MEEQINCGKETHHTNCILIQHDAESTISGAKVNLQANYEYDSKKRISFKSEVSSLPAYYFKKTECDKFVFSKNDEIVKGSENTEHSSLKTLSWILCRKKNNEESSVPGWSAFQNITSCKPNLCEVNVGYLPAITESPTKYETIYSILNLAVEIMKQLELGYIYLEVDQAIYTKILQVKFQLYRNSGDVYKRVIVEMGGFHIVICLMRSIASRFRGFGFIELLSEVGGLGGAGTIESALKGGDVKIGIRLYKLLFEALYRIKLKSIENAESESQEQLWALVEDSRKSLTYDSIQKLTSHPETKTILKMVMKGDMAVWLDYFLEMVDLMLSIIHFQRIGNWNGYLETFYHFLPYCFALNRHNYARNLSYHYLDMIDLKRINPEAYAYLESGGFSGFLSGSKHSNIPMDQIIEMTINRFSKSTGGISGKTEDAGASEKWGRLNHYLCALKEHMKKKTRTNRKDRHVELGQKRSKKDEKDVENIMEILELWVPNIYSEDQPLINIATGVPATNELKLNAQLLKERGEHDRNEFFKRIATFREETSDEINPSYNDPIKRQNLITFSDKNKKKKITSIPEDERESFADILARYDKKILDFEYLMKWPVTTCPWSICNKEENSRNTSKSLFRNRLEKMPPVKFKTIPPAIPIYIVDAMSVVRLISVSGLNPPIFKTWITNVCNYISNLPVENIHIVFDIYPDEVDNIYIDSDGIHRLQ